MALVIPFALLGTALDGCNSGGGTSGGTSLNTGVLTQSNTVKQKTPKLGNDFFLLQPGAGFDTSSNTAVSDQSCLVAANNPSNIYIANPTGYMHYGENIAFSKLEDALGISIKGSMSGGMFSGSMAASYLQNAQNNSYKMNLTYVYQYAGTATFKQGTLNQGESALTPVAASFAFGGDPVRFRKMCGDSFVSQMNAGAFLGVTVSLNFNSNADKSAFQAALAGDIPGIGSLGAKIQSAAAQSNTNVRMSISALQLGGEPQKLNNLFGSLDPSGNFPYLDCGSVNSQNPHPHACEKMMTDIITYGQSIESQVTNPNGSINLQNMYYTNAQTEKYSALGIMANAPDPSPAVLAAAQKIVKMYNDANFNYQFTRHYINTVGNYLTVASSDILADAKYRYQNQINGVYMNNAYNILECYRGYISNSCPQIEANVESALAQSPNILPSEDTYLLNYFETNTYNGNLYGYNGTGNDIKTDYQLQRCMLYPVSSPFNAQYVMSCTEDMFFPITSGFLSITQSTTPAGTQLAIDGLQYGAINPLYPSYQAQINYPNGLILNAVSPQEPNDFGVQGITITGGSSFSTSTGSLSLSLVPKEQN